MSSLMVFSIIGVLVFFVIGVLRVERKPKITRADILDAWFRFEAGCIRVHQAFLEWLDPTLAHRRSRREHEEGAQPEHEAHATGPQ